MQKLSLVAGHFPFSSTAIAFFFFFVTDGNIVVCLVIYSFSSSLQILLDMSCVCPLIF